VDSGGPKKHVLGVGLDLHKEGAIWGGNAPPYYKLESMVSCRKPTDPSDIRFGMKTQVGPRLGGGPDLPMGRGSFGVVPPFRCIVTARSIRNAICYIQYTYL